jgi:hypothetical protein
MSDAPQAVHLKTAQIGKCGELLVQYQLLLQGIESAPMSTDAGIDLVAYSPRSTRAQTIQVKTCLRPKPGGGKGKMALDWWYPAKSPAGWLVLADLSDIGRMWLFHYAEAVALAQQKPTTRPDVHLYMHLEQGVRTKHERAHVDQFDEYLLSRSMGRLHAS